MLAQIANGRAISFTKWTDVTRFQVRTVYQQVRSGVPALHLREFKKGDEPFIEDVIKTVYEEYGFTYEPDGYNLDCREVQKHYLDQGGAFWVGEVEGQIVATVGFFKISEKRCDLMRLYLYPQYRGNGFGEILFRKAVTGAAQMGFEEMEIWSDKKLTHAHAMYSRLGAIPIGDRICNDPDKSHEWGFLLKINEFLASNR